MITTTDFAKHLSRFLSEYLTHECNLSPNTISSYRDAFVQYIDFMKNVKNLPLDKLTLNQFTHENVIDFLKWLIENRNCSPATRNYRLAAIHSFVSYLQYKIIERMEQWQLILSIKSIKSEKKAFNYLSSEGIKLLLAQPDTSTKQGRRHLTILSLMYDTAARVQELVDLKVDSVRIDYEPYSVRIFGKGRKSRIVPLAKEQAAILREYMKENQLFDNQKVCEPLFFNSRHEKLTREGVSYILKTYADMARRMSSNLIPQRISCHSIRHSRAVHLLQAGVNIVYLRDILGHTSIQTTDIYARADSKAKREALEKSYSNLPMNEVGDCEWERKKDLRDWLKSL